MVATKSAWGCAKIRRTQEQFERWRAGKQGRERIPARLWRAAVKLSESYGIHRAARGLRLNYRTLQSRAAEGSSSCRQKPEFVEYNLPARMIPVVSSAEYVVEAAGDGVQRIHVRGAGAAEVAALIRALRTERPGS